MMRITTRMNSSNSWIRMMKLIMIKALRLRNLNKKIQKMKTWTRMLRMKNLRYKKVRTMTTLMRSRC
jgi:hypothetical protein